MDKPSVLDENVVSDIKDSIGNYLERPNMPRNAVQIINVDYSITCVYYQSEREFIE
jgi:predicted secreted protein